MLLRKGETSLTDVKCCICNICTNVKLQKQSTPKYRCFRDWQKNGGIGKPAVKGVVYIYLTKITYSGLKNSAAVLGVRVEAVNGGVVLGGGR